MDSPFFEIAEERLQQALGAESVHPNVHRAIADLKKRRDAEKEKLKKLLAEGRDGRGFLMTCASGYWTEVEVSTLTLGPYGGPGGNSYLVQFEDGEFTMTWGSEWFPKRATFPVPVRQGSLGLTWSGNRDLRTKKVSWSKSGRAFLRVDGEGDRLWLFQWSKGRGSLKELRIAPASDEEADS